MFVALWLLVGCGGGGAVQPQPDADLPTAAEVWTENFSLECSKAYACMASYDGSLGTWEDVYGTTAEGCLDFMLEKFGDIVPSVEAGRVTYNPLAGAKCLEDTVFPDVECDVFWSRTYYVSPSCRSMFVGTVPDGGSCTLDLDCAGQGSSCTNDVCS